MSGSWCGARGQPCDWRKPDRLLTLQIGEATNEQVASPPCGAPDGACDHMICALDLGMVVKGAAESSKNRLAETVKLSTAVDTARA